MTFEEVFELGYLSKTHGYEGALVLQIISDNPRHYQKTESVYLDLHGKLIPFFISSFRFVSKDLIVLRFEDVADEKAAAALVGRKVYLTIDKLPPLRKGQFYFHDLIGTKVHDQHLGELGTVTALYEPRDQVLVAMDYQGHEVLFPLHDHFLIDFDQENNRLKVRLPEGLLDVYIQPESEEDRNERLSSESEDEHAD